MAKCEDPKQGGRRYAIAIKVTLELVTAIFFNLSPAVFLPQKQDHLAIA
ncbi:MAG: hypothetical protein QNJ55_26215 [Xenococcus sp. MO_188.B8]|nr:hypothetical protein [Xenococcus sp. MO_188.B8]